MQSTNNTGVRRNTTRKWCGPFGCFSRSSKETVAPTASAAPARVANAAANAAAAAQRAARAARVANAKAARKAEVNAELRALMAAAAPPGGEAQQKPKLTNAEALYAQLEAEAEAEVAARAAAEGQDDEYNALKDELQEQSDKINEMSARLAGARFGGNRKKSSKLRKTRSKKSRHHRR